VGTGLVGPDLVNTGRVGWWIRRALVLAFLVKSGGQNPPAA
jgi:hypothetical protein